MPWRTTHPNQPKRYSPVTGRSGCPLLFLFFHFSAFQTKQTEQRAHKNRFSVIRVRFCSFSTPNPIPRVFQVFHFPFPSLILAIPVVFCFSEKKISAKTKALRSRVFLFVSFKFKFLNCVKLLSVWIAWSSVYMWNGGSCSFICYACSFLLHFSCFSEHWKVICLAAVDCLLVLLIWCYRLRLKWIHSIR